MAARERQDTIERLIGTELIDRKIKQLQAFNKSRAVCGSRPTASFAHEKGIRNFSKPMMRHDNLMIVGHFGQRLRSGGTFVAEEPRQGQ